MKKLKNYIEIINKIISPILKRKHGLRVDSYKEFYYLMILERIGQNLNGLKILFDDESNVSKAEHVIGLSCRNLITDVLISTFILYESESGKTSDQHIRDLFDEDFRIMNNLIGNNPSNRKIIQDIESNRIKMHRAFDKKKSTNYNKKRFPKMIDIIEYIRSKELPENAIDNLLLLSAKDVIDYWIFLSKYEHIGYNYASFTRQIDVKRLYMYMSSSIQSSVFLIMHIYTEIESNIDEYKELVKISSDLHQFIIKLSKIK